MSSDELIQKNLFGNNDDGGTNDDDQNTPPTFPPTDSSEDVQSVNLDSNSDMIAASTLLALQVVAIFARA